jgi:hypothetical protein
MKALQPPDSLHLRAAEGWIGLGDYRAATEELDQITAANRTHPDVLQLRWFISAEAQTGRAAVGDARSAGASSRPSRSPQKPSRPLEMPVYVPSLAPGGSIPAEIGQDQGIIQVALRGRHRPRPTGAVSATLVNASSPPELYSCSPTGSRTRRNK